MRWLGTEDVLCCFPRNPATIGDEDKCFDAVAMPKDQQPSVYSHITEQKHVKRPYDGIVVGGTRQKLNEYSLQQDEESRSEFITGSKSEITGPIGIF